LFAANQPDKQNAAPKAPFIPFTVFTNPLFSPFYLRKNCNFDGHSRIVNQLQVTADVGLYSLKSNLNSMSRASLLLLFFFPRFIIGGSALRQKRSFVPAHSTRGEHETRGEEGTTSIQLLRSYGAVVPCQRSATPDGVLK
jgi:hypothetical protein